VLVDMFFKCSFRRMHYVLCIILDVFSVVDAPVAPGGCNQSPENLVGLGESEAGCTGRIQAGRTSIGRHCARIERLG
jgi:hypothetical protein